ncbi:MAG TPA: hypothetical protein VKP52_16605 [Pseudolabrys sp.]|nr:hypothetical protein [Pseudolabrys sp.]
MSAQPDRAHRCLPGTPAWASSRIRAIGDCTPAIQIDASARAFGRMEPVYSQNAPYPL